MEDFRAGPRTKLCRRVVEEGLEEGSEKMLKLSQEPGYLFFLGSKSSRTLEGTSLFPMGPLPKGRSPEKKEAKPLAALFGWSASPRSTGNFSLSTTLHRPPEKRKRTQGRRSTQGVRGEESLRSVFLLLLYSSEGNLKT